MILQHATWRGVEDYLKRSTGIVVPIGSTEQHGPGGAIGTDAICAEAIAHRLAAEDGVLAGPTIALGAAQFNLAFPGTVSLRASTLMAVVSDYVKSLAAQGFTRFYFINGHGGNIAPCNAAFHDLHGEASLARSGATPAIRCRLRSWWDYEAANALRQQLYGAAEGMHATPSEIAIAIAAVPATRHPLDAFPPERLDAAVLRDIGGDRHYDAHHHRRRYPDGRIGSDSSLANAEDGARLLAAAVAGARADYARFMAEP